MSNTPDLAAILTQLQVLIERDKAALAHEIHDDLGAFLIASAMDVSLLGLRFAAHDSDSQHKFDRLVRMLNGAVDLMRRITEELHPTLLDDVGLFAALKWLIRHKRTGSSITCIHNLPDKEPHLHKAAAISLFRVGQEALILAENHPEASRLDFKMTINSDFILMQVIADGAIGSAPHENAGHCALGFLRHRIETMGGESRLAFPALGGMSLDTRVPLADALAY